MPATFAFPERDVDWWSPEALGAPGSANRAFSYITAIGRLRAGVTVEQGRADLEAAQKQLSQTFPEAEQGIRPVIVPLKEDLVGGSRRPLWMLFGAVTVLLLIACRNIGALLLSRGVQRAPEIAVRYALGASRTSVSLQLLFEAGVLALLGGLGGLVVAIGATIGLQRLAADLPRLHEAGLDLPRCRVHDRRGRHRQPAVRSDTRLARIQGPPDSGTHGGRPRFAAPLGPMVSRRDTGRVVRISARFGEEQDYGRIVQRMNRTLDELDALPGVSAVATATLPTGIPSSLPTEVALVEEPIGSRMAAESRAVSPGYFETLRIPILDGEL